MNKEKRKEYFFLIPATFICMLLSTSAWATSVSDFLVNELMQSADGKIHISYHSKTGDIRFFRAKEGYSIPQPYEVSVDSTPEQAARSFLAKYGVLFGLKDQSGELLVKRHKTADRGRSFMRFQQVYKNIPVIGGELIVQMDSMKDVLSVNGEISPEPLVDTVPTVDASIAKVKAIELVTKHYGIDPFKLQVSDPELWIYNPVLLGPGLNINTLVWRIEVRASDLSPIRELVLIDAHMGFIALHFNQIHYARYRIIYDNQNNPSYGLPGNGPVRTEGQDPTGTTDVDDAYTYAGDTYDFYYSYHGRDSIDNAGMSLINTVRYCELGEPCPYENAFWNGSQMVYGQGFTSADDVVGHEMTHGVTDFESNLFYYMQSGAINESFSDVWGEFVDLTNGRGNDDSSVRWLHGEDLPGGANRSMSNPPVYNDPDKMSSTYYECGLPDNGGVHSNNGVNNKAAYLIADGGSFNGKTVTGIGITKTAKIYYEAQTNLLTSGSDYEDLYDNLQLACDNLIGVSGITSSDCQQVKNAIDAVEMNQQPTSCPAPEAPICPSEQNPENLFFDNIESGGGNWIHAAITGSDVWFVPETDYATSGIYSIYGYDIYSISDSYIRMTAPVYIPSGAYLHFNHAYDFEYDEYDYEYYDGGVLEYSTDGTTWYDANSLFINNGYGGTISSEWGNPLSGRSAFVALSNGYISSRLNLSTLSGQNVRFRFRIGTDSSVDAFGWTIDDVRIYTCVSTDTTPPTPNPMTWATQPYAASSTSISMVATTATDSGSPPVPYYFDFVDSPTGGTGGSDSSWQSSTSYTDTGLQANHRYGYQVKARDSASTPNETSYSTPTVYKYTLANAPGTSSFSNVTQTSIQANWTANNNRSGTEYLCENTTRGTNSGWTTNTYWNETGLTCGTSYTYGVKARNGDGVETGWTNLGTQSTQACTYLLNVSKNGSGTVTSNPVGINCGSDCSESYVSGTPATLTATPFSEWVFSSWSGCDSTSGNTCYVTMSSDKNVSASFIEISPVYFFWSEQFLGHYFTINESEKDYIMANWSDVWQYIGVSFYAYPTQVPGTVPVYFFWSEQFLGHYFTINESEKDYIMANWSDVWEYIGVSFYAYPTEVTGTVPVYFFWSKQYLGHYFTINESEKDYIMANWSDVWEYIGVSFYAYPSE